MSSIKFKILILLNLIVIASLPTKAFSKDKNCTNASKKCVQIKGGVKGFTPPPASATVNSAKSKKEVKDKGKKLQRVFQVSTRPEVMATLKKEKSSPPILKSEPQARQVESTTDKK